MSAALLATAFAVAQSVASTAAAAPANTKGTTSPVTNQVEDIVVTAQRRSENLQRVPVSVTAITGVNLARANITSTTALQQVTPGLTFGTFARSAFPYIRGIGTPDTSIGNESSVATYIDGVYIESTPAAVLELNNIERIEVLKGPQGTLFGRNATGGLIQIITRTPSQVTKGSFEVGYGNYQTVRVNGYLTGGLTRNLAADLAVSYSNQGKGWGHNLTLGREINSGRTFAARSKLLLDLDQTRFTLAGDYTYQGTDIGAERNLVSGVLGRSTSPPAPPAPIAPLRGFYDSQSNIYPYGVLRTGGVSLRVEREFGGARLASLSSFRKTHLTTSFDIDETAGNVQAVFIDNRIRAFTQELQLTSQGNGPLRWIAGVFYMHRNAEQPYERIVGTALPPFLGGGITITNGVTNNTVAPYAQATLRLGHGTSVTAGARYTVEHQRYHGYQTNAAGVIVARANPAYDRATYKKPTWRLAVDQQLTDDILIYASYNRGFKSGVYNTNAVADRPVEPEIVDAFEIGFKTQLLDRRLRFNAAAYYNKYRNIQLNVATGNPASPTIALNAGRARIEGVEASVELVPLRGLTLSFGANYMPTAKYVEFRNAPFFNPNPVYGGNLPPLTVDDSGNRMIRAPKFTGTASIAYTIPVGDGDIDLSANYYRSSRFLWNVDDVDIAAINHFRSRYQQPNYSTIGGQISYRARRGPMIALWIKNAGGKKYFSGLSETGVGDAYIPAPPRTYGVKLGFSF